MKASLHYLTLAEFGRCPKLSHLMNDTLCRRAWDKNCTDSMYMTIEYTTKGKLCEHGAIKNFNIHFERINWRHCRHCGCTCLVKPSQPDELAVLEAVAFLIFQQISN